MADNEAAARCGPAPRPVARHVGNDGALLPSPLQAKGCGGRG